MELNCTDSVTINVYPSGCTDTSALIITQLLSVMMVLVWLVVYGCTDSTMFNYDSLANTDDGSCIPIIYGCTDPIMFNYDLFVILMTVHVFQ